MKLRDYQEEAISQIWKEINEKRTALCVLPTGSGKSILIAELIKKSMSVKPDIKVLVLFNKVTLLAQLAERFKNILGEETVGIYCGSMDEKDSSRTVTVGSIQSVKPEALNYNLIIIDETHALDEEKGRYQKLLTHQMEMNPKTRVVGFTATPFRLNGFIYGKNKFFERICYTRNLSYFIQKGFLVQPVAKEPDHVFDTSKFRILRGEYRQEDIDAQAMNEAMARDQVSDALNRMQSRQKVVWFCSSINHAELIKKILISFGETASIIHSKLDWDRREKEQRYFENDINRHLVNVTVVTEGFDLPKIDCIVLMRPTRSPVIMVQACGRGLRPWGDKKDCLILDYSNVISTIGPLEDPVIQKSGRGKVELQKPTKTCPECRTIVHPAVMECPSCGFSWPKLEATKINLSPDEAAQFLKSKLISAEVMAVRLSLHESKAGNKCIKISYQLKGSLFMAEVPEYFAHENEYAYKKFSIRAMDLGIKITSDYLDQVKYQPTIIPKQINYIMDGKYPKIKSLIF